MENITNATAVKRSLVSEDYIIIGVSALSIILNVLTILAICKGARKIYNHYLLVINQCAVDIVYCVSSIANLVNFGFSSYDRCTVVSLWILVIVSCGLVLTNLCAMTVDHFIAIYNAMRYAAIVTRKRILKGLLLMYGAYGFILLSLILTGFFPMNGDTSKLCLERQRNLSFVGMNVLFGITLVLVIAVYSYIFHKSRTRPPASSNGTKASLKKTWTSLWIIATFLVCFGFDVILFLLDGVVTSKDGILMARRVTRILHEINFICDPIIYAIRLSNVRAGYRNLWLSCTGSGQGFESQQSIKATGDTNML